MPAALPEDIHRSIRHEIALKLYEYRRSPRELLRQEPPNPSIDPMLWFAARMYRPTRHHEPVNQVDPEFGRACLRRHRTTAITLAAFRLKQDTESFRTVVQQVMRLVAAESADPGIKQAVDAVLLRARML